MDPLAVPAQPDDESRVRRRSRTSRTFDDDAEVQAARAAVVAEAEACLVGEASDAGAPAAAPSAAPDAAVAEGEPPASPALPFDHDDPSSPSRVRRKSRNSRCFDDDPEIAAARGHVADAQAALASDESRVRRRSRASKTFEDDPGVAAARADILGEAQASLVANA